jgi:sugar/nucleoside kinase (ribokinase family)
MFKNHPNYKCICLGSIGKDEYGTKIIESLESSGTIPLFEIQEEHKTSRCACAIANKERCLLPEIRASTHLSMDFVKKNIDTINKCDILLVEGYFVIEKFDIVKHLVEEFKDKKITFTLSATFMVEAFYDRMLEIANQSHIVICNNEEASSFSKSSSTDFEEVAAIIHKQLKPLNRILIITCGKNPAIVSRWNYNLDCFDYVLKSTVYPLTNDEIVDTDGAGDGI